MSKVVIATAGRARMAALADAVRACCGVVVEEACSTGDALEVSVDTTVDAVVIDEYPSAAVLRTIADATLARPDVAVLVTGPVFPALEAMVVLASGARGYLPAGSEADVVAAAVSGLLTGEVILPGPVSASLVQLLRWSERGLAVEGHEGRTAALTNREWAVVVLLRQGRSTVDIAQRLLISPGTVRSHVASVLRKFGLDAREQLVLPAQPHAPVET